MIVQETDNLPSQRGRLRRLARGSIRIEELLLEGDGDGVPLRNEGGLEASKNMLFGLGDGRAVDISFNDVVLRKHVLQS
jgi:hypothetical protein